MKSPAWHRGWRKGARTAVQLIAGGALTALVTAVAGGLNPQTAALVLGAWTVVVAIAQNVAETAGKVPVLLPTPGLVPSVGKPLERAVGTVETTVDRVGDAVGGVAGTVEDVAGGLLGEVVDVDSQED